MNHTAVLLMALGGPDSVENVEPYLVDVRGGRPTPPHLIEEIRQRYRLTGGRSPVLGIMREVASLLEQRLNAHGPERHRVSIGMRHWHPYIKDAYAELMAEGPNRLICICMAPQYSALSIGAYRKKVEEARAALGGAFPLSYVESWYRHPGLIHAIAQNIRDAFKKFPPEIRSTVPIIFTAHSLPERILRMNDPYPEQVHGTMQSVCVELGSVDARFAYQSQGRSDEPWLGPTVESTIEALHREGHRHVLIAPIGFLSDHLEVLYDIDIEFRRLAESKGMQLERMAMLNADPSLIATLASLIQEHQASLVG